MIHTHRERTKVMHAGDFDLARVHGVENSRHETDARAVAQFGIVKAKLADLAQHGATIRMSLRIPTGGKRIHALRL
jgi:hypothetical protein